MTIILTKQTKSNGTAIVSYESGTLYAELDGKKIGSTCMGVKKLREASGEITHYIDTRPALAFTTAEAETIASAIKAIRNDDPRIQRAAITSRAQNALDQIDYHHNRQDGGTGQRFNDAAKYQDAYDQAMADLKAFDDAHPELTAQLQAEAAKRTEDLIAASYRQ